MTRQPGLRTYSLLPALLVLITIVAVVTGTIALRSIETRLVEAGMDRSDVRASIQSVLWEVGGAGVVAWLPMFVLLLWTSSRLKRAWAVAKENEESLATTLASVGDGVIATDRKGRIAFMNPLAEALTGWQADRAKGKALGEVFRAVDEDTGRPVESPVATVMRTGELVALGRRVRLITPDGAERPIESSVAPTRNAQGAVAGVVLAFRDESARRRAERRQATQLAASIALMEAGTLDGAAPRLLRSVCETAGWELGGIWLVDPDAQVLRNESLWCLPTLSADAFVQLSRASTFAPGIGLPGRVWSGGKPAWITDVTKDPNFPRASAAAQAGLHAAFGFPIKGLVEVYGVIEFFSREVRPLDRDLLDMMSDIGIKIGQFVERRRAAEAARASEARFRLAIDHATDAMLCLDGRNVIRWANQQTSVITGRPLDSLVGCPLMKAFSNQPMAKAHLSAIGQGGPVPTMMEFEVFLQDGTARWLEVTATRIKQADEPVGWLLVARDRTERKQIERHLRQSEKMASLGTLLDGIAHELKNPLFMISGYAQLAAEEIERGRYDNLADELAAIQDATGRAADIVQRTLAVSRSTNGQRVPCRVNDHVRRALELAANDLAIQQIETRTALAAELPDILADPHDVMQVFLGLIANAREAMAAAHQGGTLTVTSARVSDAGRSWVEIRVADDGPGIAPEHQPRLFEPFFTLKPAGQAAGLGLSIVHRIVTELGGTLTLESAVGQGSTFIIRLPEAVSAPREPALQATGEMR